MDEGVLPAAVLDDVASVVGAQVTLLSRLPGGVNGGAMRVQLAGGANAVLKAVPRAHPNHLDETLRAQRVVGHMRRHGYPTPAWLGVGATATHVWHLMDFVDAAPAPELTPSLIEQLMEIIGVSLNAIIASGTRMGSISQPRNGEANNSTQTLASEASLKIPDLGGDDVQFLGMSGYSLLLWGLLICVAGLVFGEETARAELMSQISEFVGEDAAAAGREAGIGRTGAGLATGGFGARVTGLRVAGECCHFGAGGFPLG